MKLSPQQRGRAAASLKKLGVIAAVGLGYALWVRVIGRGIPCLFEKVTGLFCPGCGATRMCMALLQLDIWAAIHYNVLLMTLLPFGIFFGLRRWLIYVKTGDGKADLPEKIAAWIALVMTIAFWILRNIPYFSILAPAA